MVDPDPDFIPETDEQLIECLGSWMWRIYSGAIYKIKTKESDDDSTDLVVPFRPNSSQCRLLADLNNLNIILKARLMGFSTLI